MSKLRIRVDIRFAGIAVISLFAFLLSIPYADLVLADEIHSHFRAMAFPVLLGVGFSPLLFVWAVIKMLLSLRQIPAEESMPPEVTILSGDTNYATLLPHMEKRIEAQAKLSRLRMQRFERHGQIAATLAILVSIISWFTALLNASDANDRRNMWQLIVSGSSFGLISTTIAVTLLRHSKIHALAANQFDAYKDAIRRMRIALDGESGDINEDFLRISGKYAKHPAAIEIDEPNSPASEEVKNAFSLISALLPKT